MKSKIYTDIEEDLFTPGISGKLYLVLAGAKPRLVKSIPYEARRQRFIGGMLFLFFLAMIFGQLYLLFELKIKYSGHLLVSALTGVGLILSVLFLRYVNSPGYKQKAALVFMVPVILLCWVLLIPTVLSFQTRGLKSGIHTYKYFQRVSVNDQFLSDSAEAYRNDDSTRIREELSKPFQQNIVQVSDYLINLEDSIQLLTRISDSLQKIYAVNDKEVKRLSAAIKDFEYRAGILVSQKNSKGNQLKSIEDSIIMIIDIIAKEPDNGRYRILNRALVNRKSQVSEDIYKLRKTITYTNDSSAYARGELNTYLKPAINANNQYKNVTRLLSGLIESKADAEVQIGDLQDSLARINRSDKLDGQVSNLRVIREYRLNELETTPMNWLTIIGATDLLVRGEPEFKAKFILITLLLGFPVVFLFAYAVLRKNYYRQVNFDYELIQQRRTETKARSFIDIEELKYSNIDLEKRLSELNVNQPQLDKMETLQTPEDYYYITAQKQEELAKQTKNTSYYDPHILDEGIENINKAISLVPDRSEFWELKVRLLLLDGQVTESQQAAERFKELRSAELFRNNLQHKIYLDEVIVEGLPFFGSFSWRMNPGVNILLGRNGYGKSHFLSIICAMLKNDHGRSEKLSRINDIKTDKRYIKLYLAGDLTVNTELIDKRKKEIKEIEAEMKTAELQTTEKADHRRKTTQKESIKKKKIEIEVEEGMIMLSPSDLLSGKGQVPVLAIPDMRFVNKAKEYTDGSESDLLKGDDYLKNTSHHFIQQEPFESILQNLLNILGTTFFENGRSFDAYIFRIVSEVFRELTGNSFKWENCESDSQGGYRIMVLTEGSALPLPIQKISQGTFSVLSIVGLIHLFLKKKYPEYEDEQVVKQQAIIVIDEIDAHLHPLWQQKIVNIIRGIFENCQFVITAHSPMVVAGCKEGEVAVMRDERDTGNNITGFFVYQFKEDFIGTPIETLYSRIFQVEEKDQQYLHYTAMQPFLKEMTAEKERLETKAELTEIEKKRLKQLADDVYYAGKVNEKQEGKHSASMLESENTALKITLDTLKHKIDEMQKTTTTNP